MKQAIAALIKARKQMGPALKSSINPHFKSRYVDLQGVYDACLDALLENGLVPVQGATTGGPGAFGTGDDGPSLMTALMHESGEMIGPYSYPLAPSKPNDPQSLGAAMTYARRYSLMALLSLAPEDDDGTTASQPAEAPKPAPKAPVTQAATAAVTAPQKAAATAPAIVATPSAAAGADGPAPTGEIMIIAAKHMGKTKEQIAEWATKTLGRPVKSLREAKASEVGKLRAAAGIK
jgi:hypothetical protein